MTEVKFNKSIDITKPDKKRNVKRPANRQAPKRSADDIRNQIHKAMEFAGGKYVKFDDVDHVEGLLFGGVKKNNSFLFAVMDRDKHVVYVTTDNHFSVIRDVTPSLYILNYVYRHDPEYLYDLALDQLEHDKAELFTNCYIQKNKGKGSKKVK